RGIGDDVHVYGCLGAGGEIDTLEVFAGVNRRVDEIVVGNGLEGGRVAGLRGRLQRRAELPAFRQCHARLDRDVTRKIAGRIERQVVPVEHQHAIGHLEAAATRREVLEVQVE